MWEFLLKINPNLIVFCRKNGNEFENLIELALNKGYVPSFRALKLNNNILDYIGEDFDLQKMVIEKNPRSLSLFWSVSNNLVKYAMSCGYKPRIKDIKYSSLCSNDIIMRDLIKKNPKNIEYYDGNSQRLIDAALRAGWVPTKRAIMRNDMLARNDSVIYKMIDKNPKNILLYLGVNDDKVVKYALEKGYVPTLDDIKKGNILSCNYEIMCRFVRENPGNIVYYRGNDNKLFQEALDLGYVPDIDDIKDSNLSYSVVIMRNLIKKDPKTIIYYRGRDVNLVKEAIELGFRPTQEDFVENLNFLNKDESIMRLLIQKDPNYIAFCTNKTAKLISEAIELGYVPNLEHVKKNRNLRNSDIIFKYLIEIDPQSVVYYSGKNAEIIDTAIKNGYIPTIAGVKKSLALALNDSVMKKLIMEDPNAIVYYRGNNQEVFDLALTMGYKPNERDISNEEYYNLCRSDKIMKIMIEKDFRYIKLYRGSNQEVVNLALEKGYVPTKIDLKKNNLFRSNKLIIESFLKEDVKNLNFYKTFGDDVMTLALQVFEKINGIDVPDHYAEIFKVYKGDISRFCFNYKILSKFLNDIGVSEKLFFQYAFSKSYNWLDDIIKINANGRMNEFKKVKEYFFENYYLIDSNQTDAFEINSFLNILKNYTKFPELCVDIVSQNRPLTHEEIMHLNMVFVVSNIFDNKNKPKSINDLSNVVLNIKEIYREKLSKSVNGGLDVMKDTLCQLLFNSDQMELAENLSIFGDTKVLRQLLFNNRHHPEMQSYIRKLMLHTSVIEDVLAVNDPIVLKGIINKVLDNFESVVQLSSQFYDYEKEMRYLYEMDIQSNVTKFDNISNLDSVIDKEKTSKYGVEVLDYSDKKYCLLVHVMSGRENPQELIEGLAIKNKNFICLSSISNRNQVYYTNPGTNKIIFATDTLPNGLFLQSSITNMGSNGYIDQNDGEVEEISRIQRGVLETSHAPRGNNSEILTYRSGLKFNYIVLPGGREPTAEEVELAKEYGLKFVVTQQVRESVKNPVEIEMKSAELVEEKNDKREGEESVSDTRKLFMPESSKKSIAILTDAHGLFEPTLAVLEDARKRGITEIYSLGDNIGTGPNPSAVMDLLDEYGVISLLGNHELYVSLGVDAFRDHLERAGSHAYSEALRSSSWTANQLTHEQKERLRLCDKMIELVLGEKRILLCHDIEDFNTGDIIVDTDIYDEVFRGHKHFEKKEGNITTIPGVGIGTNAGKATYLILTEKEGGGYTREFVTIDYDKENMKYGIIESSMSSEDKEKIEKWAGVSDGTKKR